MAAKSMEAALQEVLDREEIRTLPVRYCHTVWQKDLDGYVNLFTKDGSISTNDKSLPDAQGHEALRKMIGTGLDAMRPRPFIHNHVVELLGADRAKGTCYLEVKLIRDGKKHAVSGWYNDEYAKENGEWKFKSRKIVVDSSEPV
ncbi:MAG: nuclear transport factor 2 family protein [Deltaproteobacteria bacterium]|nr:nuclear transport factor 2 family protein [Deltaproteobacteria bacterium]